MLEHQLDDLTGAMQRVHLADAMARLEGEHRTTGAHHALAVLDLDHLKVLNDVYGHATGDAALIAVAERTLKVLRGNDMLFRYGGDEFVVLLPNTNRAEAEAVLYRVHDQVTGNPVAAAVWVSINLSIGVAATDEEAGVAGLFERADARVRRAKRGGRNRVVAADQPEAAPRLELAETRLLGRDEQLAAFDAFLAGRGESAGRVLRVGAEKGAGVARFLQEVAVRGRQAGLVVRRLVGERTGRDVHLLAMERAYAGRTQRGSHGDALEDDFRTRLRNDAEAHGLLLLVTGGRWLDPASASLAGESLRRGGTKLVEVVIDGDDAAFGADRHAELRPLADAEVEAWLSGALGGPLAPDVSAELARAGAGLPGRIARLALRLLEDGVLRRGAAGWDAGVEAVRTALAETAAQRPHAPVDVPRWDTPLVGRGRWLAAARQAAREQPLVTLVGPGGAGKTRLAAQLALDLASDPACDAPGGTHWVDLRAVRSAVELPSAMADALGLPRIDDLGALAQRLRDARLRIVLDNADGVADDAGALVGLLALAPRLRLLVTARMPLRVSGERVLEVPELEAAAAGELFRHGMRRVGADEAIGEDGLDELLELVGRSPLAVELAAAWTRVLTPGELIASLRKRPDLLGAAPGLQPSTARFIDVTRDLMSEAERETLGTLALIPAGFAAEEGRAASGASSFFLLALLERSLVRREGERYTVHAAIAERYRAGLADPARAQLAVARAYSALARRLNDLPSAERTERGFRRVDAERANLEHALKYLAARGAAADAAGGRATAPPSSCAEASAQVWPLAELLRGYLDVRGRYRQGAELFQAVDRAMTWCDDRELRGWVRESLALHLMRQGREAEARRKVEEAIAMLEEVGPSKTLGMALNTAGILASQEGRLEEALARLGAAARMRAALDDEFGEAQSRGNIAFMLASTERFEEAFAALEAAADRYRAVGHKSGLSLALVGMGRLASAHGLRPQEEALALAREGQALAERLGYANGARSAATDVGTILLRLGRYEEAATALERAGHWARVEENAAAARDLLAQAARARGERAGAEAEGVPA